MGAPVAPPSSVEQPAGSARLWWVITAVEVALASVAVALDLLIPTFVLLAMAGVSLLVRRDGPSSLGLSRPSTPWLAARMAAFAAAWSLFQLAVTMPIADHLSGREQDLSAFDDLQGDLGQLVLLLVLSWTVAAVGEEIAYRGYLQTRMRQLFGPGWAGLVVAVVASSLLFGRAHSEQGIIGVLVVSLDAVAFSYVRYRYRTVWASVLMHGWNNSFGFVAFYLVGPIHGFW